MERGTADEIRMFGKVFFGVWAVVAAYAMLHDQYVVRLAPEHFTVYHPNPFHIETPWLHALQTAFGASFGPGLLLGFGAFIVARAGSWPKVPLGVIFRGILVVIGLTEACADVAGLADHLGLGTVFPDAVYRGLTPPLHLTQTIQLACYSASALFSMGFLGFLLFRRRRLFRVSAQVPTAVEG